MPRRHARQHGFNLLELMIAMVIISILASVAIPAYNNSQLKARRSEATATLLQIATAQERHRLSNASYANVFSAPIWNGTTSTSEGNYTLSYVGTPDGTSFTVRATATGAQASDTACASFDIDQDGPVTGTAAQRTCWNM